MSFFEDASLVLIPSAYKDQKVYSVKPTDGTGDLTFTRASSATRVQSDGLIEKVRTNLALYSEDLTNAAYIPQNATLTGNTTTAPDGTTTADTFNEGTLTTTHRFYQQFTITANQEYAFSFYAKKNTIDIIRLVVNDLSENFRWFGAQFNLTSGTITATATGSLGGATYIGGSIVDVGNGWYRCSINGTINATTALCFVNSSTSTAITSSDDRGGISYTGTSRTFFGWGTQFETGVTTDYIATTTAAVSVGPVSGLPRLDYLGSTCPRLLLEPQRSNLVFFSEQLNNAGWAVNAVVTANTAVSPDGSTNADSVMESATTAFQIIGDPVATTSGTAYTYSFFAKPNGRNFARILFGNGSFPDSQSAYFNLLTGATSASASVTASMVSYGNGWYRCIATATSDASASDAVYLGPARNMTDGYATYAGNASLGIYAWGVQQEAGAYATSYIPTLGASVTRVADAASKTGISSLIGQTEGTIFFDLPPTTFSPLVSSLILIELDGNIAAGYAHLYKSASPNEVIFQLNNAGALQCSLNFALNNSTAYKIAAVYKNNRFELYVNGVLRASDYSGTLAAITMNKIQVAGDSFNANSQIATSQVLLFKTALTQAQCEQLTA